VKETNQPSSGLRDGIRDVMLDADALLAATAGMGQAPVVNARQRLAQSLQTTRDACSSIDSAAAKGVGPANKMVSASSREPAGIAFGIGALIGFLIGRRS